MSIDLAIAVAALVLAATSIGVHIYQWRRSGPAVRTTAAQAFLTFMDGISDPQTCVTASNEGRSPITITSWGFEIGKGKTIVVPRPMPASDKLPHRLEPGSQAKLFTPTSNVTDKCKEIGFDYRRVRAFVGLPGGRRVYARRRGIGLK